MEQVIRNIAIRRLRCLPVKSGAMDFITRSAYLSELVNFGFRVKSANVFSNTLLSSFRDDILELKALRGGDVNYSPLFLGFPNNVPDKDAFYSKRILGFYSNLIGYFDNEESYTLENGIVVPEWLFDLNKFGADPILGRQDINIYENAIKDESNKKEDSHVEWIDLRLVEEGNVKDLLIEWVASNLYSKSSLKESLREDIEKLVGYYGNEIVGKLFFKNIVFKETKSYLTNYFWNKEMYEAAMDCVDNSTDILRLMASLTNSQVSLSTPIKFPKLNRRQRRAILSAIDRFDNPEDLQRYRSLWISLGRGLHPGEYKDRYPRAFKSFDVIRNGKVETFNSKVEKAINNGHFFAASNLLKTRPTLFGRRLHHLLEISGNNWGLVLDNFEEVSHEIPLKNLIVMQSYFRTIEDSEYRTVVNKKGKLRVFGNKKNRISKECNNKLNQVLSSAIDRVIQNKPSWNGSKVWIDPDIRNYLVPLSQRNATDGLLSLERGSRIPIDTSKIVRLFIYWKQNEKRTDLDLSAITYDENMKFLGQVSYTNLRNGNIIHSGDITSAAYGASEFIDIPINNIKKTMPNVRYISTQVYIYSGENFFDLDKCYAGWMIRDKADSSQKSFDVKTVQSKFDIKGNGRYVIPCLLDIKENQIIYTDLYMPGKQIYNRVEESISDISIVTKQVANMYNTRPNMFDLAVANSIGRGGEIVDDKELADITFGVAECDYNVSDIELILNDLI